MENRNSNITSIIVAIISIGLIIFSVWLLNATFNNRSRETTVASNSNSSSSNSSSSSSVTEINSSSRGTVIDPNETSPGISQSSSQSSTRLSSSANSNQSNSSLASSRSGSSNSSSSTSLKSGEITAVLIEPTAKGSNFEIVECNIPNPIFCKAGFRFPYGEFDSNGALTLFRGTVGDKYIFSGGKVTDTTDGLSIGGVTPKKVS